MKCPECQSDNRTGAKFCIECGNKLEIKCSKCDHLNPSGSKFCEECGSALSLPAELIPKDISFDEKIEKIQKYLPQGLTEKILSQRDRIEGEKKQVTVLFCDMVGFTSLFERIEPDDAYEIMDQVYEILIHKVHDYEGTVNEMTGDGIMALFGAPVALEDAPQRAIRSSLAIHREMAKFSDQLKQEKRDIPPIKMRIGIHTGPVVVGTVGNDLRVEFKAVGDTVNLASRMEGMAEPGSTYVTENTFKLTEGLFRFEALGERQVKGKGKPVHVYRVIAPSTRRTRFDVSAERGLTPLVGRERELEILLDSFERSRTGRGQALSIMAEAGLGKSRLLYEFRKSIIHEDVIFLEGKCLSYSRGAAYHPIIDILKSNFDVQPGDHDLDIKNKVKKGLHILSVDESSTLPYLLELLSVKDSGIDKIPMSPEAKKDRIIEAVKRITLKGSEIKPHIIATEDLHWVDKSSEEYLKVLMDSISGTKVFLLFTYRPEFVHTWGMKSYHSQINLNRLSNRESLAMTTHLLGRMEIDSNLEELILEKTEGVPFFIEEFIKSLKDLKIIKKMKNAYHLAKDIQNVSIPSTIHDVIMARVDTLPQGAKELLQTGSVIEREFSYELLKRVTGTSQEELLSHLSILKDSELLYERGIYPESTYIFKHALTQEAVYDSILTKRRKRLHDEIGNAIEELFKDKIDEHYGVLAEHFTESENYEKSAEYSRLTSRRAEKTVSLNDAIVYAKNQVASLEKLPRTDDVLTKLIDARTRLGLYYNQLTFHLDAREAIDPIFELAIKHSYKKRLSQIHMIMGSCSFFALENFAKASKHLQEALKISRESEDVISLVFANYWLGGVQSFNCDFEKGSYYFGKTLEINVARKSLWGISTQKSCLGCFVYDFEGKVNLGFQTTAEALRIAEESGDIYSKALAHAFHSVSCFLKGFFEEAKEHSLKGADLCERINSLFPNAKAYESLGQTCFEIGEYQKSKDYYGKAIRILERGGFASSFVNFYKLCIARAKVMNDERDIDLESLYGYVYENKMKIYNGWMRRYIGEILLNIDDNHFPNAEEWIKQAIEADKLNGMVWHLGRDYALYAEFYNRQGDPVKARENLSKAIQIFKECGADGWVEKYEKEITILS